MGQQFTRLLEPVSQASNERWLSSISPIKGEARAFMVGIAAGAIFHESRFGLAWERRNIMVPLQQDELRAGCGLSRPKMTRRVFV